MPQSDTAATWRLKIQHTCDSALLRERAKARLDEYKRAAKTAKIVLKDAAGVDVVEVTVIGATVTIILGFHPGMVMVAVKVPAIIKAFRKFVEDNIRGEIEAVVGAAGGRLLAISNEKGENL